MIANRYLKLASHHFFRAFTAFNFFLAFAAWAWAAALHECPFWSAASALAAVACAIVTYLQARDAIRCHRIAHRYFPTQTTTNETNNHGEKSQQPTHG